MRAIVLTAFGDASHFVSKEVDTPQPKKGEVRIRVKAAGFNPVDVKIRQGMYGGQTPLILGADCSGVIDALGPEATGFSVGDEVYANPFGQSSNGSYAEFLCIPTTFVAKKPSSISFEQAASLPVATMTAYRAMIASQAIQKGGRIFIAGAGGGVGSLAVQIAQSAGVEAIYTVAGSEESAHFLQSALGLKREHILLYKGLTPEQLHTKLIEMNKGVLFDATFDFVGQEMKTLCLQLARHSGHMATIVPEGEDYSVPVWTRGKSPCFAKNLSLHCIFLGAESFSGPPASWAIYTKHLRAISRKIDEGSLQPPPIQVIKGLSVPSVLAAHAQLETGHTKGKLVMSNVI